MKFVIKINGFDWNTTFLCDSEELNKEEGEGFGNEPLPVVKISLPFSKRDRMEMKYWINVKFQLAMKTAAKLDGLWEETDYATWKHAVGILGYSDCTYYPKA